MGSTAAAQADHLPPAEEVQLFGHNGALALGCSQTVTAVESERKHLIVEEEEEEEVEHSAGISDKQGQAGTVPVRPVGNRSHSRHTNINTSRRHRSELHTLLSCY